MHLSAFIVEFIAGPGPVCDERPLTVPRFEWVIWLDLSYE